MTIKKFDLEDRTLSFGKDIINLVNLLPRNTVNLTIGRQVVRSGTSIGANYREANASLGNKDFLMKIKICRKEAMETCYWLKLLLENNLALAERIKSLIDEVEQLVKIFSKIALVRS